MNISNFFEPIRIGTSINVLRNATTLESYNNTEERVCSICQSPYTEGTIIRKISHCNHFYHHHCLDQWLENNTKCPECQYDIRESVRPTTSTPIQTQTPTAVLSYMPENFEAEVESFVTNLFQNRSSENRPPIVSSIDILIPSETRNLFRSSEHPRPQPQPQPQTQSQSPQPQPQSQHQPRTHQQYYYPQQYQSYYYPPPQPYYYPPPPPIQSQSTLNERRMISTINRLERIVNQLQQQNRNNNQSRNQQQ